MCITRMWCYIHFDIGKMQMKKVMKPMFSQECEKGDILHLDGYRIENLLFEDNELTTNYVQKEFFECKFHHINVHTTLKNCEFVDVIFDHCDFSNANMEECVFHRCEFIACRLTGIDLSVSTFTDVWMVGCQCAFSNMNATKWKQVKWEEVIFREASFYGVKFKDIDVDKCDFSCCEIHETPLRGIDFSNSNIEGIAVLADNLKGVKVNSEQAIALAQLLGIQVV